MCTSPMNHLPSFSKLFFKKAQTLGGGGGVGTGPGGPDHCLKLLTFCKGPGIMRVGPLPLFPKRFMPPPTHTHFEKLYGGPDR